MTTLNIKAVTEDGTFEDVLAQFSPEVQAIGVALRSLLAEVMPNITEVPWQHQKTIGYGVGPKKMSEHFCYIAPQKNYLNLGFMYGADLPDPAQLLEGTGKKLRHIKIKSLEDVQRPEIRRLIEQACTHLPKLT